MRITKEQLKQIIKEETKGVLLEKNFDGDVGFPLNVATMKKMLSNERALQRFEKYNNWPVKVMKYIVKYEDILQQKGKIESTIQDTIEKMKKHDKIHGSIDAAKKEKATAEKKIKDDREKYEKMLQKGLANRKDQLNQMQRKFLEDFYKMIDNVGGDDALRSHYEKRTNGRFDYESWKKANIKFYTANNPELYKWAMDNYERG